MATAADVLREARKEIGYTESPAGSNRTKFAAEAGHANGTYWCATFTSAILRRVGLKEPNSAATAVILREYKRLGRFDNKPTPGDLVIYDFPGGRVPNDPSDHIGFVEQVNPDGTLVTIEGNTSSGNSGSQSNGGGVFRRHRPRTYVVGFGHPNYQEDEMASTDVEKIKADLLAIKKILGVGEDAAADHKIINLLVEAREGKFLEATDELRDALMAYVDVQLAATEARIIETIKQQA